MAPPAEAIPPITSEDAQSENLILEQTNSSTSNKIPSAMITNSEDNFSIISENDNPKNHILELTNTSTTHNQPKLDLRIQNLSLWLM